MLDKLIQFMEDLDKQIEDPENTQDNFCTDFGHEFEVNYQDLLTFVSVATLTPTFLKMGLKLSRDSSSGELFKQIPSLIDQAENLTSVEKAQEKETLAQFTELWTKIRELIDDSDDATEPKDGSEEEIEFEDYLEEAQIYSRILSHFIIVLYAYIDIYTMSLCQLINYLTDVKEIEYHQIQQKMGHIQDPYERVKYILKITNNGNLWNTLQQCLKTKNWDVHQDSIKKMIRLRHQVAHRKPLPTLQEFHEIFQQFKESVRNQAIDFISSEKLEIPSEYFRNILINPFKGEVFKLFLMIRYVASSCYRYIAIIDKIVDHWRKHNK